MLTLNHLRSSLAHGVPMHISQDQHDVPIPDLRALLTFANVSSEESKTVECFVLLCRLTTVLGKALPLAYQLRPTPADWVSRELRHLETYVEEWEDALPNWAKSVVQDDAAAVPGSKSLYLGFLSLKLLLCRISYRVCKLISFRNMLGYRTWNYADRNRRNPRDILPLVAANLGIKRSPDSSRPARISYVSPPPSPTTIYGISGSLVGSAPRCARLALTQPSFELILNSLVRRRFSLNFRGDGGLTVRH